MAGKDPLAIYAQHICEHAKDRLPDLSKVIVLLPDTLHIGRLPQYFLNAARDALGHTALIAPYITTPKQLALERDVQDPPLTRLERHFRLGIALVEHPGLFKDINRWQLSDHLLSLFDELSLRDEIKGTGFLSPSTETLLQLHKAWRDHLGDSNNDPVDIYRRKLVNNTLTRDDEYVFLCGFDKLLPVEEAWASRLAKRGQLTRINDEPCDDALHEVLGLCFDHQSPLKINEQQKSNLPANGISERVRVFTPCDVEEHARGIALAVEHWLDDGITPINIVTQDRRLARRLLSLFADRNIPLLDRAGWALSTSVSAAAIQFLINDATPPERLLQLIRTHFIKLPDGADRAGLQMKIETLLQKRDIPLRTWDDIEKRAATLDDADDTRLPHLKFVIGALKDIERLREDGDMKTPYDTYFNALKQAMDTLGMSEKLKTDEVGNEIMQQLEEMHRVSRSHDAQGTWGSWRAYINYIFETKDFVAKKQPTSDINLLSFRQARLSYSRGLILAGLDTQHAGVSHPPLLTKINAQELGFDELTVLTQDLRNEHRRLIENSECSLISYEADKEENVAPLPWVEMLRSFHELNWESLTDTELASAAERAMRQIHNPENKPHDEESAPMTMPAPSGDKRTLTSLSPHAYQQAVHCPYKFFAHYELGLRPIKEVWDGIIDPKLNGTKVHRCMALLVNRRKGGDIAKDFVAAWIRGDEEKAIALGEKVVKNEYKDFVSYNFVNRYRLNDALRIVRKYIHWLFGNITINSETTLLPEHKYVVDVDNTLSLEGRVDLAVEQTDSQSNTHAEIVDYKTGSTVIPYRAMKSGRDVQLAFYTLLEPKTAKATYVYPEKVQLLSRVPKTKIRPALDEVRMKLEKSIQEFHRDYDAGKPLPADGNDKICQYCDCEGLCRRPLWKN